jgi:hypothetical protein
MNDDTLGLLTLVTLLIFGIFLINLCPERFQNNEDPERVRNDRAEIAKIDEAIELEERDKREEERDKREEEEDNRKRQQMESKKAYAEISKKDQENI